MSGPPPTGNPLNEARCGAQKRGGSPCQRHPIPGRRRCHLHGGRAGRKPTHGEHQQPRLVWDALPPDDREIVEGTDPATLPDMWAKLEVWRLDRLVKRFVVGEIVDDEFDRLLTIRLDSARRIYATFENARAQRARAGLDDAAKDAVSQHGADIREALAQVAQAVRDAKNVDALIGETATMPSEDEMNPRVALRAALAEVERLKAELATRPRGAQ